MATERPQIGIVLASRAEWEPMQPAIQTLERLGCAFAVHLAPVWPDLRELVRWAAEAERAGMRVLIAASGAVPQLPGMLAASCNLPVLTVPLAVGSFRDAEMLQLALATAPTAPVAAVEPGGAEAAALLALRILAGADEGWFGVLDQYRRDALGEASAQPAEVETRQQSFEEDSYSYADREDEPVQIRPVDLNRPLRGTTASRPEREAVAPPSPSRARHVGRRPIDPDAPQVEAIEEAVDCLLEGGIVALPTETVYGLAVDATNADAVDRLYALKNRPRGKAMTLMIDNPKMLAAIACNLTVEVRRLMEAFWPGPLTIVFRKRMGNFDHVCAEPTIGVRLPDHSVPLSIIQALARPLACTSANLSGQPEASSADAIEDSLGDGVNMILDAGELPASSPSTVIDVTGEPYRILRQGTISIGQLAAIVGEKLEDFS